MHIRCPSCESSHEVPVPGNGEPATSDGSPLLGTAVQCSDCGDVVDYYVLTLS